MCQHLVKSLNFQEQKFLVSRSGMHSDCTTSIDFKATPLKSQSKGLFLYLHICKRVQEEKSALAMGKRISVLYEFFRIYAKMFLSSNLKLSSYVVFFLFFFNHRKDNKEPKPWLMISTFILQSTNESL